MSAAPYRVIYADDAPPAQTGYTRVPREVTATKCAELSARAKVVLTAIIGTCWGDSRTTYASVDELATKSGYSRRAAQIALHDLVDAKRIARDRDRDKPGSPWRTVVLVDPGMKPRAPKEPLKIASQQEETPRKPLRNVAHNLARCRQTLARTPPLYKEY